MVDSYIPGDISVSAFSLFSKRGSLDLKYSFVSASIFESIFYPGIVAHISVLDSDDQLGQLKIVGDETVKLSIELPDNTTTNYELAMHSLEHANMTTASLSSKTYLIKAVSVESLVAKNNNIQKSYNSTISDIVKDIHKNYLNSTKDIEVETTKGKQNVLFPKVLPYKAIDLVRKRAISDKNKSSVFVYFETRDSSKQKFKFVTIESLFKQSPIKTYTQVDTINTSIYNQAENNIIALETPQVFNTHHRLKLGGKSRVTYFDFRTHTFKIKDIDTKSTDYTTGGTGSYDSSDFKKRFQSPKIPNQSLIPVDYSQRAVTHISENTADQNQFIATLTQNSLKLRVFGDFKLKPGEMITLNIPNKSTITGPRDNDPLLSGNFLITRLHHDIGLMSERPRYTCVVECVKGNLEEGV